MISSTALDLPEHRELAKQACLDAGFFPIGMEELPAQDATGIAASMEMVDQADVYLGVYAFRYGWIPEDQDVSITEMEFDRAVARKTEGKLQEILIFTAHKKHPFTAEDIEADKTAQAKLSEFKTRAATGRVRKEFKSAEELRREVLHALEEFKQRLLRAENNGPDTPPVRASIPNNLPRLQYFFGRDKELTTIAKALAPDARGWGVLIDGPGGIGKTALAIRAAELVPKDRFNRIIFLSSKERELTADGQRTLGNFILPGYLEMLNAIAREIGHADIGKTPEADRPEAVNRALRDSDVLLVLDNLETLPEQDRDLLFAFLNRLPRGCSAITTSRRRADASAVIVRLDKLDWPDARDLMSEIAKTNELLGGATEAQQRALHEETGGSPLLIRWVAGQLGLGRCRTIVSALDFLRNAPPGNDPLQFIFGDLLDTFSDNETKVVAALSYFTTPMEVKFIAELGGVSGTAAQSALESLSYRALVVPDVEERSFVLVPTVADFLRKARPEVVKETGNRLENRAYALIVENGYGKHDRFPVLDSAWPTVAPALPLFLAGPNDRLQTVCRALFQPFNFSGRYDESFFLNQQAEAKAVAAEDYYNAGWRAYNAGWVHLLRDQADAVLACAARSAAHWVKAQAGGREHAIAVQLRGHGHGLTKDYPAAIAAYREVLDLDRSLSTESQDVAIDLNDLASAEQLAGDFPAAERDFREALRVAHAVGDDEGIAIYTANLSTLAMDREDWPKAEVLAREALALAEKVGRRELIAGINARLAKALARLGRKAEGLRHARLAVEVLTKLASPDLKEAQETLAECGG